MRKPKPFSDEELKEIKTWAETAILSHHHPDDIDNEVLHNEARSVDRFLDTIAEYKVAMDSAMTQVSSLNQGNIADRKRIEELEKLLEEEGYRFPEKEARQAIGKEEKNG